MNIAINKTAALSLLLTLLPAAANAAPTTGMPVHNLDNGHYYEFVAASQITWDAANSAANDLTFWGIAGHLATITSAAEDDFIEVERQKTSLGEVWVGGFQDPINTLDAKLNWTWLNGEGSFPGNNSGPGYANFNLANNEPNDNYGAGSEQHLTVGLGDSRKWNDEGITLTTGLGNITGYLVEYEIVARDDEAEASSGVPKTIDVLTNDLPTLSTAVPYEVTIEGVLLSGFEAIVKDDNSVEYKSPTTFEGVDTFKYRVTDANGAFAIATVTVTVSAAVSTVVPGINQLIFNQFANPTPSRPNPLTAAYQQVLVGGDVTISCCRVLDTREIPKNGKKPAYYSPGYLDIGAAVGDLGTNPDCDEMPDIAPGTAVMQPWHRVVPKSARLGSESDITTRDKDFAVCHIQADVLSDGVVYSAEQARNVLGHYLNYGVPTLQNRPFTVGVAVDPLELEVGAPYFTRLTAETDESRSAKKYSDNVIVLNVWHMWLLRASRPYLWDMATEILDSIDDARDEGLVDPDFLNELETLMVQARARILLLPRSRADEAVALLENATLLTLRPYSTIGDPYGGSLENWKGLWAGRTMALKFAVCSELQHTLSSASTLDNACFILPEILALMPSLP